MKKYILIISVLFISCSKPELIIGHWHTYNPSQIDFVDCYKFTDTSFIENDYKTFRVVNNFFNNKTKTLDFDYSHFTIKNNNRLILNDTITWVRPDKSFKTFIDDFSSGLFINIQPYETDKSKFDISQFNNEILDNVGNKIVFDSINKYNIFEYPHIYIGKLKNQYTNKFSKLNKIDTSKYQIQIEDRIIKIKERDLRNYIYLFLKRSPNLDSSTFIIADKCIPKKLISEVEKELELMGISKSQIFI